MMKKMRYAAAALAAAAIMTAGLGQAWAYFTTYASAEGGYTINLGDRTEITEEFSDWTKRVTVSNEAGAAPVYVRARAFGPSTYPLTYTGSGWTAGADGYYYYGNPVPGGGSTEALNIAIGNIPTKEDGLEVGDQFNVIVIYESTPVLYDAGGNPLPADWNAALDIVSTTETVRPAETETTAASGEENVSGGGNTSGEENQPVEEGGGES